MFRQKELRNSHIAIVNPNTEARVALFCKQTRIPFFLPFLIDRRPQNENINLLWPGLIAVALNSEATKQRFAAYKYVQRILKCDSHSLEQMKKFGVFNRKAESGFLLDEGPLKGKKIHIVKGPLKGFIPQNFDIRNDGSAEISLQLLGKQVKANLSSSAFSVDSEVVSLDEAIFGLERRQSDALRAKTIDVNAELIRYLRQKPDYLHQISPLKFEEVVGEILVDMGFDIQFTQRSGGDGGRDILAAISLPIGRLLTIVECKRYQFSNKVGTDIVERFIYTIDRKDNASCGLIATTSFFSGEAKALEDKFKWRLKLRDFDGIREWLNQYGSWKVDGKSGLFIPQGKILADVISP